MSKRKLDDASLMKGVNEDLMTLITHFSEQKSWKYSSFKRSWTALNFQYIFSGRHVLIELQMFTRELLVRVKYFTQPGHKLFERLGALYALYTLYMVQPLLKKIKIRILHNEVNNLRLFVDSLKSQSNQPAYCFYVLLKKYAFDFVHSSQEYTAEKLKGMVTKSEFIMTDSLNVQAATRERLGITLDVGGFDTFSWIKEEGSHNQHKSRINAFLGEEDDAFKLRDFLTALEEVGVPTADHKKETVLISRNKARPNGTTRRLTAKRTLVAQQKERELMDEDDEDMDLDALPELS